MKENIVLIGMPGSGKSTVGRILAKKIGLIFIDLDEEIERYTHETIPALFEKGEEHFRKMESEVTELFSKQTPLVIATGGGIILKEDNIKTLSRNGIIIFLNRSLENIHSDVDLATRPLLEEGVEKLYILHEERIDLYYHYADLVIENDGKPDRAIEQIMGKLYDLEEKGY